MQETSWSSTVVVLLYTSEAQTPTYVEVLLFLFTHCRWMNTNTARQECATRSLHPPCRTTDRRRTDVLFGGCQNPTELQQGRLLVRFSLRRLRFSILTHTSVLLYSDTVVVVVVVDSHIQRIVLATEETTVTQQVSHRPIKRQSRLWSQRGTKVNGSHHGDNPLLRPTGIQIATKSYAALQAMAPTNIKTVHQTSLLHSRATSIDSECCRLPTTSVLSKKPEKLRSNQF